jgi:non-ribosomal peptide synthetase component F
MRGEGEERIALLLEHDAPMIAALLGVLKSGKTLRAAGPFYPRERLLYILKDSQASAIVSNRENQGLANQLARIRCPLSILKTCAIFWSSEASRVSRCRQIRPPTFSTPLDQRGNPKVSCRIIGTSCTTSEITQTISGLAPKIV